MKNRASSYLKQMITVLSSMAKSKTLALKSKTNALRTRIIIFSLLRRNNNFFTVSSINHKLQSLLHHHSDPKHEVVEYDDANGEVNVSESSSEASVVLHSNNAMTDEHTQLLDYDYANHGDYELHQKDQDEKYPDLTHEPVPDPAHTQLLDHDHDHANYRDYELHQKDQNQEEEKYPDLTHSLFGTEDGLELEGSVIELVKNSKQQEGEEFRLEDEIDQVADLFIKRFHHQMRLQKQQSLKRYQEMLQGST